MTAEKERLDQEKEKKAYWRRWGPYLSERQWGTVREDYSANGDAWNYFPHADAIWRAYRWGEDGICGICDNHQRLCFAFAFWNGKDPILKERLFGLTGDQANHGEDVKECYYYIDNVPSHAYMKALYKYPQGLFPYEDLIAENGRRTRKQPEYELLDTGVFDDDRYYDCFIEYAKGRPDQVYIKLTVANRGPEEAILHVIPTLWFRNTWSWKRGEQRPEIAREGDKLKATHPTLGDRWLLAEGSPEFLYTHNETNTQHPNPIPEKKDAFHHTLIHGAKGVCNVRESGTKVGLHYTLTVPAQSSMTIALLLTDDSKDTLQGYEKVFAQRKQDGDDFYDTFIPKVLSDEQQRVERQAFAGMLWTKQFYNFVVEEWLKGDEAYPPPPVDRLKGRDVEWGHIYNDDVLSMPDSWEYPWFASWDMAFHTIPLAMIDPEFAKRQLLRLTREWYIHPNGQMPAYEWNFSDVNPPVHAWAAWRVYKIDQKSHGKGDLLFLEKVFQKLLLNFTWWVNRKDFDGKNLFQGGFLGLDNISIFDRSAELPEGGHLSQSDGTSWMAMYALNMLTIALELTKQSPSYEDIASKFFEHFLYISDAMTHMGENGLELWNEEDGFFYDVLQLPDGSHFPLKVRSYVGLIPLLAVMTIEPETLSQLKGFHKRLEWFLDHRGEMCGKVACMRTEGSQGRRMLSIVDANKLKKILRRVFDSEEFLGDYGIRSISAFHRAHPFGLKLGSQEYCVGYEPAESETPLFGGNSNWRGPIWFPINFLLIESLQKFHYYYGDDFKVEFPQGSGVEMNLWDISQELSKRMIAIFTKDENGVRPFDRDWPKKFREDPHFSPYVQFNEYFHGDTGAGLGANHQTGWTGVVAKLIQQTGDYT